MKRGGEDPGLALYGPRAHRMNKHWDPSLLLFRLVSVDRNNGFVVVPKAREEQRELPVILWFIEPDRVTGTGYGASV